jgi:protein involved in ribonucleotide reduction
VDISKKIDPTVEQIEMLEQSTYFRTREKFMILLETYGSGQIGMRRKLVFKLDRLLAQVTQSF